MSQNILSINKKEMNNFSKEELKLLKKSNPILFTKVKDLIKAQKAQEVQHRKTQRQLKKTIKEKDREAKKQQRIAERHAKNLID